MYSEFDHLDAAFLFFVLEFVDFVGADRLKNIALTLQKAQRHGVEVGNDREDHVVRVRQALALWIDAKVIRVAFEQDVLRRSVFLELVGAAADQLRRRRIDAERGFESVFLHGLFERMFRQNKYGPKVFQERRVNFGCDNLYGEIIDLANFKIFASDPEEVGGDVVYFWVVDNIPCEFHIIRRKRLTVGPPHAFAQFECPRFLVLGNLPGLREPGPGLGTDQVHVDEAGEEKADDFGR